MANQKDLDIQAWYEAMSGGNKKAYEKIFISKHQEEMYKEWKLKEGGFLFYE